MKEDDDPFEDEKPKEEACGSPQSDGMGCLELLCPRLLPGQEAKEEERSSLEPFAFTPKRPEPSPFYSPA